MMMRHRKTTSIAAFAAIALAAAACGDDDGASTSNAPSDTAAAPVETSAETSVETSGEPIVIGYINQDGGTRANPAATVGVEATVAYINSELGGVGGRPLEVRTCLVRESEEEALNCAQEMANDDDVVLVTLGFVGPSSPLYPTLADVGKSVVGGTPASGLDTSVPNAIFYDPGLPGIAAAVAQFALDNLSPERLGVMQFSGDLGQTTAQALAPILDPSGIDYVAAGNEPDGSSTTSAAASLGDVDTVLAVVSGPSCIQLAQALPSLPIADATVVATSGCLSPEVRDVVGDEALDGWYSVTLTPHPELEGDEDIDLYREVLLEYGGTDQFHALSLRKFTDMLAIRDILLPLVEAGDELTPESVWDAALAFTGPLVAGAPDVVCPGPATAPAVCATQARAAQFKDGGFTDALDGEFFDVGA